MELSGFENTRLFGRTFALHAKTGKAAPSERHGILEIASAKNASLGQLMKLSRFEIMRLFGRTFVLHASAGKNAPSE